MRAGGFELFQHGWVLADVAYVFHYADVDGGGGEVERVAVLHEAVEEGVCGCVVALAPLADDAGYGAEEEEEVKVLGGEGGVQVPGAFDLGSYGCVPVIVCEVEETSVLVLSAWS